MCGCVEAIGWLQGTTLLSSSRVILVCDDEFSLPKGQLSALYRLFLPPRRTSTFRGGHRRFFLPFCMFGFSLVVGRCVRCRTAAIISGWVSTVVVVRCVSL